MEAGGGARGERAGGAGLGGAGGGHGGHGGPRASCYDMSSFPGMLSCHEMLSCHAVSARHDVSECQKWSCIKLDAVTSPEAYGPCIGGLRLPLRQE